MDAPTKRHAGDTYEQIGEKYSSQDVHRKKLEHFLTWAETNKFNLSAKVRVGRDGSCAQLGMIATAHIDEGEELFQITRPMLLSCETSGVSAIIREDKGIKESGSGWVPLLVALMYEYNNPTSPWRPYLDLVPDFKELDLPMFWPREEVVSLLGGTGVVEAVERDRVNITQEFTTIVLPFVKKHEDKFSPVCQDIEFYKKMVAFVMSYSFTEPDNLEDIEDEDEDEEHSTPPPMMVPMADILNHVANNNANLTFEKDCLKMVATRPIKKGEEVYNTYGQLANWHLLHMYGFAEKFPANHYDTVEIHALILLDASKVLPVYNENLHAKKKTLLEKLGWLQESAPSVCIVGTEGILTEDETLQVLKVLVMTEEELRLYQENEGWEDADDDVEDECFTFDNLKKLRKEQQIILSRSADTSLKRYSSTMQGDVKLLTDSSLTSRNRFSLYTNYGQKKLLKQLIDACTVPV